MTDSTAIRTHFLSELENSSEETRRVRLIPVDKWLNYVADKPLSEWDKVAVSGFRTMLENETDKNGKPKYKASTIRQMLQVVSRVFDAAKVVHEQEKMKLIQSADPKDPATMATILQVMTKQGPNWNVGKRGWLPEVQSEDRDHPAIPLQDLKKLIDFAKAGKLGVAEVAFLALASIYGLRKSELITVLPEHINYQANTIWLDTHKHGEKRSQLLVKEIVPYLKKYDFRLEYSPNQMHSMFVRMCAKAGVKLVKHQNWHSVRRLLDTVLLDALSGDPNLNRHAEFIVHRWFRWKTASLEERYYTPDDADKIVIQRHPVVKLWR